MGTLGTILAVIGGVWVVGRLSRRSRHHPINSVPLVIDKITVVQQPQLPSAGTWQETAQFQGGGLIAGEDGGE